MNQTIGKRFPDLEMADQDGQVENDPEILLTRSPRNCQFEAD